MAQPTYEELVNSVNGMKTLLADYKTKLDTFSATDDSKDKDMDASFKKAQDEMDDKDKEHSATTDELEKVKDAFKKAEDETDPDKKKEAMKKALEMKDENEKSAKSYKSKNATDDNDEDDIKHDAKVAAVVMKKIPLMQKILSATRIIDPANADKLEKYLTAATLEQVEEKWQSIQPFVAAAGLEQKTASVNGFPGMVPFQASQVTGENPSDIFSASVDDIDFSKVPTSKIMEMYH